MWFFVFIFLAAGVALLFGARWVTRQSIKARGWPTVNGILESCEVVEIPGMRVEDTSSWQLRLRYSYVVNGKTHHSTQYAYGYGDGRDDAPHRRVAEELKRMPTLTVHYDPARPSEAVLNTDVPNSIASLGRFCMLMAAISFLIAMLQRQSG